MPKGNFDTDISDKDIVATPAAEILEKTAAFPGIQKVSDPRCYEQYAEDPITDSPADGKEHLIPGMSNATD